MMHVAGVNRSYLFAAATAISAIGVLTVAADVQADPMVPLAPPCDQWAFPGDVLIREAGTGWDVSFSSSGQSAGGRATATGPGGTKSGNISGGMTKGGHVTLTVRYDNGQFQQYVGDVGDDAKLHGVTQNNVPNESGIRWSTVFPISCSKAPLELPIPEEIPEPAPAPPAPAPEQAPPAQRLDRDQDGMFDDDETNGHNNCGCVTDPAKADTDGDGVNDGAEDDNNTNPLDPNDF
jgi:hypothetical protein